MDEELESPEGEIKQPEYKGSKERLYDMIPLTKKHLDIIIAILLVALVVFLVLGALIGNGVI